jgi:hypothetical protein
VKETVAIITKNLGGYVLLNNLPKEPTFFHYLALETGKKVGHTVLETGELKEYLPGYKFVLSGKKGEIQIYTGIKYINKTKKETLLKIAMEHMAGKYPIPKEVTFVLVEN